MDIAVTGSSGLIGTALCRALERDGHRVRRVVRRAVRDGESAIAWDPAAGTVDAAAFEGLDGVIHLAGAGIGDKRWSEDYKREILESRTRSTDLLARTLAGLERKPSVFVSGSAIGIYGDRGDELLTEQSPPGSGFLADVVVAWEAAARPAVEAGIRVPFVRTGIVLSPDGGALPKLLPLFKAGVGGKMGSGRQWWSWISLPDELAAIRWLLDHDVAGPVNLTAPAPVTNAEFTKVLARVLKRPAVLPVPAFGPKLLRGAELAQELLFNSQRVQPSVLETEGFPFLHADLEAALRTLLERPAEAA
ncbi:MAG: TIGR01777 family oxidoreductase [Acidimicrobiales bacterium]|jgi:hypothetical protein|nr:TIGR01777 family oxidoreductase [Acidimicrobiales bacterium]